MEYHDLNTWEIVKRFIIGWGIGLLGLIFYSCVRHWDFITASFASQTWAWINATMPLVILIVAIASIIRTFLR